MDELMDKERPPEVSQFIITKGEWEISCHPFKGTFTATDDCEIKLICIKSKGENDND